MQLQVYYTGSSGNFNVVSDNKTSIAIDCGVKFKQIKNCIKISSLSACLITHSHKDHCLAVEDMAKSGIAIYTSQGTSQEIANKSKNSNTLNDIQKISNGDIVQVGTLKIMPFNTIHDTQEPLGFIIQSTLDNETLLFATDTGYIPIFENIKFDLLAIECNWDKATLLNSCENDDKIPLEVLQRSVQTHYSFEKCLDYLSQINLCNTKEIILLHTSKSRGNIKLYKDIITDIFSIKVR